ncbi:hypothetical protein B0H14DRAFT_2592138 [Mycena olivaceomarginata]|nr:hypothetical protein B0H14DRAFT_2592138 [Mycena olivaceomarginata]
MPPFFWFVPSSRCGDFFNVIDIEKIGPAGVEVSATTYDAAEVDCAWTFLNTQDSIAVECPFSWDMISNVSVSMSIPSGSAGVYVVPSSGVILFPGSRLLGAFTWTRREILEGVTWGTSLPRVTLYTAEVMSLQTIPASRIFESSLATLNLFQFSELAPTIFQEAWVDKNDESVLNDPQAEGPGGLPGSESAGIVAFIREHLVDLGEDPRISADDEPNVEAQTQTAEKMNEVGNPATAPIPVESGKAEVFSHGTAFIDVEAVEDSCPSEHERRHGYIVRPRPLGACEHTRLSALLLAFALHPRIPPSLHRLYVPCVHHSRTLAAVQDFLRCGSFVLTLTLYLHAQPRSVLCTSSGRACSVPSLRNVSSRSFYAERSCMDEIDDSQETTRRQQDAMMQYCRLLPRMKINHWEPQQGEKQRTSGQSDTVPAGKAESEPNETAREKKVLSGDRG